MITATKTSEFKRAPLSFSHVESELLSVYAMVAMVLIVRPPLGEESSPLRIETRITTESMQIETGVKILMISSPQSSRMLLGLGFCSIISPKCSVLGE